MQFTLKNTDDKCDVYEWVNENELEKLTIFHWKDRNIISFEYMVFVLKNEAMLIPMSNEEDEWLKHSCRYGHWAKRDFDYDEETLEFALTLLKQSKENEL